MGHGFLEPLAQRHTRGVLYEARPKHPPANFSYVADQNYASTACFMRNRHTAEWIGTYDTDEFIESRPSSWLPDALAAVPPAVEEVAMPHCTLVRDNAAAAAVDGKEHDWRARMVPDSATPALGEPLLRICRSDRKTVYTKSLGRVSAVGFAHVHFYFPSEAGGCAWRWPADHGGVGAPPPLSCIISADYPTARGLSQQGRLMLDGNVTFNHVNPRWLGRLGQDEWATERAFVNQTAVGRVREELQRLGVE